MRLGRRSLAVAVAAGALVRASPAHAGAKDACIASADRGQDLRDHDKLRAAREAFLACAADACPAVVRKLCVQWVGDVEMRMPSVVFAATRGGQGVTDVRVSADGAPLVDRLEGAAVPIDPGPHVFRFERAGSDPVERTVVVREGEKFQRIDITFEAPPPPPPAPRPAPSASGATSAPAEPPKETTSESPMRLVGLVAAGAGVVALGVGTYFGLHAKSVYDAAGPHCPTPSTCDPVGVSEGSRAHQVATVSTVLFAAGGALLVGGAVLYFAVPRSAGTARSVRVAPLVGQAGGGAVVIGSW